MMQSGSLALSTVADHSNLLQDWTLREGTGSRSYISYIKFDKVFSAQPNVIISLTGFDSSKASNTRINVYTQNVTITGFEVVFNTWSDSAIYGAAINWLAYTDQ